MINSKDISIVIQGAIDEENTPKCIKSIRKQLKDAEIVLSTWENSDVNNLDYDVLIENKDPGNFIDSSQMKFKNNIHRQIISTKNGIKKANRKFVMKLRGDVKLQSANFLNFWNSNPKRIEKYKLFSHKILCSEYFFKKTIGLKKVMPVPFHLGDWAQFGTKEDMLKLWNIDVPKEPEFSNYFSNNENFCSKKNLYVPFHQFAPEQYILIETCKKNNINITMRDCLDYNAENIEMSEQLISNNFIIIPIKKWSYQPLKEPYRTWAREVLPEDIAYNLYTEKLLNADYKKYIIKKRKYNAK